MREAHGLASQAETAKVSEKTLFARCNSGITSSMEINELLAEIDSLKAEIDKVRPLKPEVEQRVMQKFRLDWNYHSNAIEGNALTIGETRAFLLEGLTAKSKPLKDHLDIKGHDELITFLVEFIQRKERLTEAAVREMHKILLKAPYETDAITPDGRIVKKQVQLGAYKSEPNCVRMGSGEVHQYAMPHDVSPKMAELMEWHQSNQLHPAVHAAQFHYRFVDIHPFDDGNGRMARVLMNLILMRAGFPPAVIKLQERDSYVAALRRADAGETDGIVEFVCTNVRASETLYLRGACGESVEDPDDVDKEIALFKQQLSHIQPAIPLTRAVQLEFITRYGIPLLRMVEGKFQQFDELFAETSLHVMASAKAARGLPGQNAYNKTSTRVAAVNELAHFFNNYNRLVGTVYCGFKWKTFTRGPLKAFDIELILEMKFEELKVEIKPTTSPTPLISKPYPAHLTDIEMRTMAADLARLVLKNIMKLSKAP